MSYGLIKSGILALKAAEQVTIASGVATITQGVVQLTSETSTTDDLDTITLNSAVNIETYLPFVILIAASGHTITVKHGTDNITLNAAGDFSLTDVKALLLWNDGTNYHDLGA